MNYLKCLIIFIFLILVGCSSTNIDLKKSDIEWLNEFDFYTGHYDGLLIKNENLILTHYSRKFELVGTNSIYFENIFIFDQVTGKLIEHKFIGDTLTSRDINWDEKYNKFGNRFVWPKAFNMKSNYELNIDIKESGPVHLEKISYELEIKKDEKKYQMSLDKLGEIRIEYYLLYSNELYLWVVSDNLNSSAGSFLYKFDLDKIIDKH